jgi:hypothetical protein
VDPSCAPAPPGFQPRFLALEIGSLRERHGYRFQFYPGVTFDAERPHGTSLTAISNFAVVAVPVGNYKSSRRSFCTDATASIYFTAGASAPRVQAGRCLDTDNQLGGMR